MPRAKDYSGRVNEADRLFHATRFVAAFLRQALEPFVSGQCDIEQRRLPSDCREIAGRKGVQLIQRGPVVSFVSRAQSLKLRPKQLPTLLRLQVVKLDLECEAAQGRRIEALHQVRRTDKQAVETFHLRQHLVDASTWARIIQVLQMLTEREMLRGRSHFSAEHELPIASWG